MHKIHFLLNCGLSLKRNLGRKAQALNTGGKKWKEEREENVGKWGTFHSPFDHCCVHMAYSSVAKGTYSVMTFHLCLLALCSLPVSHTKHSWGGKNPQPSSIQCGLPLTCNLPPHPPSQMFRTFQPNLSTFLLNFLGNILVWRDSFPPTSYVQYT